MEKQYYFLSGLPRSGSTLLSAILNQNPDIYSSTNSPLLDLIHYNENFILHQSEQYQSYPRPKAAYNVISSIANNFYLDRKEKIIIDKSRGWTAETKHITDYITDKPKFICPVRDILDILVSFLSLAENSNNNMIDDILRNNNIEINNENRCDFLMGKNGTVKLSYDSLLKCFNSKWNNCMLFVEYDNLVQDPQGEINKIYDFLDMHPYKHNFDFIETEMEENDLIYGFKNMHKVRPKIEKVKKDMLKYLSNYSIKKYSNMEFWRKHSEKNKDNFIFGL